MEQIRYTIVIEDGKLAGASQHNGNLDAVPLSLAELVAVVPSINAAAITAREELEAVNAAKDARITAAETAAQELLEVAKNPTVDLNELAPAIIAKAMQSEAEKIREEKLAQLEALKAELGIA